MGKDVKVREQAEKLAQFLLWSDRVIKSAVSAQPYAALAWSGVSLLLPLLTSGAMQNVAMLKGFNSIGDIQLYWKSCEDTYLLSPHQHNYQDLIEPLSKLYSYLIEYQARVICHLSSTQLTRAWQKVAGWNDWSGKERDIGDSHTRCEGYINPLQQREVRKHRDRQLQLMQESCRIILQALEKGKQDEKETRLLQDLALASLGYEADKDFNPNRVQGTCEWFFADERVCKWRDSESSCLLWVSAGPGCGKSVLSRALIDEGHLATSVNTITITSSAITTSTGTTSTVCYFFFKDGDDRRMDAAHALCAILHQLFSAASTSSLIKHALYSHKNYGKALAENFSELWRIRVECVKSSDAGEIVCVLDALDECNKSSRREIIGKLKDFYFREQRQLNTKLKFLITSRPYDDLEKSFGTFSATTAYLRFDGDDKSEQISRDINLVIEARVDKVASSFRLEDRRKISQRLQNMKNRTYLWLHLTFNIIEESPSEYSRRSDIEGILSDLPSQVSDAYEKMLDRGKNSAKTEALLQIVLAAARPLTLDEANYALALALQKQKFASHRDLEAARWYEDFKGVVKNFCGLFINVYDSKLSFIHQTAREFLTGTPQPNMKWKGRFSNIPKSHNTISRCCLHYLLLPDLPARDQSNSADDQEYPLIDYAATNWPFHYTSQDTAARDDSRKDARMLCRISGAQARVWGPISLRRLSGWRYRTDWTDLALASYFGLLPVVNDILTEGSVDINARGRYYGTALQAASAEGHKGVVQILLDKNADVNAEGGLYRTAAVAAASKGGVEVMQVLLSKGEEVKITADVVKAAAGNWQSGKGVMALLLEKGGDEVKITADVVKAAAGNGGSGKEVMALLLEKRPEGLQITEEVVGTIAGRFGAGIMALLLEKRGDEVGITANVVKAAARNGGSGKEVIALLETRGDEVKITADVV